jgi:hypothetical protein
VYVAGGTFTMDGGAVSGNSAEYGGGVYVAGPFTMSGGAVSGNSLSGTGSYGREVLIAGIFIMSGSAQPERIFLYDNSRFITISGDLSGGTATVIDLGINSGGSLTDWDNKQILQLDSSYSLGDLASLKTHFSLGNSQLTESPYTETPIPTTGPGAYEIDDTGRFVAVP